MSQFLPPASLLERATRLRDAWLALYDSEPYTPSQRLLWRALLDEWEERLHPRVEKGSGDPSGEFTAGGGGGGGTVKPSASAGRSKALSTRAATGENPKQREATYTKLLESKEAKHPGRSYSKRAVEDASGIIHSDEVTDIARALYEGRKVNMISHDMVATSIDYLGKVASRMAKMRGGEKMVLDLCNASVEGTNLFCAESKGIPRVKMPQLSGVPTPGTPASRLPANARGAVDIQPQFRQHLQELGFSITEEEVAADHLKASQNQLDSEKIADLANKMRGGERKAEEPIFVSDDNYVVDGHHRWAAKVAVGFDDGTLGGTTMPVSRINMPITELLQIANDFAAQMGIPQAAVGAVDPPKQAALPKVDLKASLSNADFENVSKALTEDFVAAAGYSPDDDVGYLPTSDAHMSISVADLDGTDNKAPSMALSLDFRRGVATFEFLRVAPSDKTGKGVGKGIVAAQVATLREMGFKKIELYANLDVGGYAWAKYGFNPDYAVWEDMVPKLVKDLEKMAKLGQSGVKSKSTEIAGGKIEDLIKSLNPQRPGSIQNVVNSKITVGGYPIGKALLLGRSWEGSLDFSDRFQMERFEREVVAKSKKRAA